jgi:hypothetical protein
MPDRIEGLEEEVEASARVLYLSRYPDQNWMWVDPPTKHTYRGLARAAIRPFLSSIANQEHRLVREALMGEFDLRIKTAAQNRNVFMVESYQRAKDTTLAIFDDLDGDDGEAVSITPTSKEED